MTKLPLALTQEGQGALPKVAFLREAGKLRDELIKSADKIKGVNDEGDQTLALAEVSQLRAFIKNVDDTKKVLKGPVDALGKEILRVAEEAAAPAINALNRIRGFMESYQIRQAQEKRRIEEEARRKDEAARKAQADAEAARIAADKKKSVLAETKAERMEEKAVDTRVAVMQLEQKAENTRAKGGRMELDLEVLDIHEFYCEHPELCTVTIKLREAKEYLKRRAEKEKIEIPQEHGLRVFLKPMVTFR